MCLYMWMMNKLKQIMVMYMCMCVYMWMMYKLKQIMVIHTTPEIHRCITKTMLTSGANCIEVEADETKTSLEIIKKYITAVSSISDIATNKAQ